MHLGEISSFKLVAWGIFPFPRQQFRNHILESIGLKRSGEHLANDEKSIKKASTVSQEIQTAISLPFDLLEILIDSYFDTGELV